LRRYRETGDTRVVGFQRQLTARHRNGTLVPISLAVNEIDHLGLYLGVIHDVSELRKLQTEVLHASAEVQRRIGQALHDGPQQALAGMGLLARGLAIDLAKVSSPHEEMARRLAAGLQEANRVIRGLARGLVPAHIGTRGLAGALRQLAGQLTEDYPIDCTFSGSGSIRITDDYVVDQLYYIAQEASLNAARHSGAQHIRIDLENRDSSLVLRVVDDGVGFDPKTTHSAGLGLHIMPYRAANIGAGLSISAAQGGGTEVTCTLPLSSD
jgi:signal transduction histidine kinase